MPNSSIEASYKMVNLYNTEMCVGVESRQHKMLGFGLVVMKHSVLLPVSKSGAFFSEQC